MQQHLQTTLLGFALSLILTAFSVNADTANTTTPKVSYGYCYHFNDPSEEAYHRLLPDLPPGECSYHTRVIATANIDDTPEKEDIVIVVVDTKQGVDFGNWHQAFLLITNTEAEKRKEKALFELFDTGTHPLEVPAQSIELHPPPFEVKQPTDVLFRLVDLTGDGTLDVWVESAHGVALISFENGEFKEVFSNYTITREKLAETPEIETYSYNVPSDPEGQKYHRFLATPEPEGIRYFNTRQTAIANIDDTPKKENIVLMTADTGIDGPQGEWVQAFLLIAEDEAGVLKKKELFKLFDAGTHHFDVPGKTVEIQSAPFVLREWTKTGGSPWAFQWVFFDLVDLTGDGILDIWIEQAQGVAVISFQNGEFKEVCSGYSSVRSESPIEYVDLDNDGIYEIKIPDSIYSKGAPGAANLEWMSFYEWDGTTYVLNNERFYTENDEFFLRLLGQYASWHRYAIHETYSYYIGLVFYYRGNIPMAYKYLQWVANHAEKQRYVHAAEDLLKKLTHR